MTNQSRLTARRLVSTFMRQIEKVPPGIPYATGAGLTLAWEILWLAGKRKTALPVAIWAVAFVAYGAHNQRHRPKRRVDR